MSLAVVDSGGANITSVMQALKRLGAEAVFTDDTAVIRAADRVILPGVGSAGAAMDRLRASGLDTVLPQLSQPVLGICLGMQLLFRHSSEDDTPLLGIIGRLVPIKNDGLALRVLKGLRDQGIPAHLCVDGDGEEKAGLQHQAEVLGIDRFVHWPGWIQEIEQVYRSIDVLLLTSRNEGTPVTIIEAFASRIPVVATRVGGVRDLLQGQTNGLGCSSGPYPPDPR